MPASQPATPRASATFGPMLSALLLAASLSAPMAAQAQAVLTQNFDGLACGDGNPGKPYLEMTNEGGLDWSNFHCLKADTFTGNPSGYKAGLTSGTNVGYNSGGVMATLTRPGGTIFSLVDAQITAAWNNGMTVTITGSRAGTVINTVTLIASAIATTRVDLSSLLNVDKVTFLGSGGTKHGTYAGGGENIAFDDLRYILPPVTSVKPVPTLSQWSLALMAMLMAGFGLHAQRRKARG